MARQYLTLPASVVVEVTDEDICHGKPADACRCPVALAVQRALGIPDERDVSVWDGMVTVWNGALTEDYDLGLAARDWIEDYDLGVLVEPATFHATRQDRRLHEEAVDATEAA